MGIRIIVLNDEPTKIGLILSIIIDLEPFTLGVTNRGRILHDLCDHNVMV